MTHEPYATAKALIKTRSVLKMKEGIVDGFKKALLLGSIAAVVATCFELKWLNATISVEEFRFQMIAIAFFYQDIMFIGLLLPIFLTRNHLRQSKIEHRRLTRREGFVLIFQFCSALFVVISMCFFPIVIVIKVLSGVFIALGIIFYKKMKSDLVISCVLWGVELYMMTYFYVVMDMAFSTWSEV